MQTSTLVVPHMYKRTACLHSHVFKTTTVVRLVFSFAEQLLNDLWLLSREVYLPLICVSGAEEHHVLDRLLDSMHCLIAATEVLGNHAKVSYVGSLGATVVQFYSG